MATRKRPSPFSNESNVADVGQLNHGKFESSCIVAFMATLRCKTKHDRRSSMFFTRKTYLQQDRRLRVLHPHPRTVTSEARAPMRGRSLLLGSTGRLGDTRRVDSQGREPVVACHGRAVPEDDRGFPVRQPDPRRDSRSVGGRPRGRVAQGRCGGGGRLGGEPTSRMTGSGATCWHSSSRGSGIEASIQV